MAMETRVSSHHWKMVITTSEHPEEAHVFLESSMPNKAVVIEDRATIIMVHRKSSILVISTADSKMLL